MKRQYIDARIDWRKTPIKWAEALGISKEAVELYLECKAIDLHIESFIWQRLGIYGLLKSHHKGALGARGYSQIDLPRALAAGMGGGVWSICTNPLRSAKNREKIFFDNLKEIRKTLDSHQDVRIVSNAREFDAAQQANRYAIWLGIQGGNALDHNPQSLTQIPDKVISRITLVHLMNSSLGSTSSPLRMRDHGLTAKGAEYIEVMNHERILVDLAHISEKGFWQAIEVHDTSQPFLVSHTGVCGVHNMWRNINDLQIKSVAQSGGVIGVIFHKGFLGKSRDGGHLDALVDHMAHIIDIVGEDHVALGSDWDGAITTPNAMPTVLELPRLVEEMLQRKWNANRIAKILSHNYVRVFKAIRP
jgi:membrane dipeptidase